MRHDVARKTGPMEPSHIALIKLSRLFLSLHFFHDNEEADVRARNRSIIREIALWATRELAYRYEQFVAVFIINAFKVCNGQISHENCRWLCEMNAAALYKTMK